MRKRCYRNFDEKKFREEVAKVSWHELYLCEDVEQAVYILTSNLTTILDQLAPIRTIQMRTRYAPWLSSDTKALIKEREMLHKPLLLKLRILIIGDSLET